MAEVQQIDRIERILYPKKDAAIVLGISVRSIEYMMASKSIRFSKRGKKVLFHISELRRVARQAVI